MNELPINQVVCGSFPAATRGWPDEKINLVIFSPPYWGLRNYGENVNTVWGGDPRCEHEWIEVVKPASSGSPGRETLEGGLATQNSAATRQKHISNTCIKCGAWHGQLGLEPTYQMYVAHLVEVGREVKRILRKDGSWYLNLGDTYATHTSKRSGQFGKDIKEGFDDVYRQNRPKQDVPEKCKLLIPYRVALALIDDGWVCRNDITWHKPNVMPSSVKDRLNCTTEKVFHFVKSREYFYDLDAIREPFKESSIKRISQVLDNQEGGEKQRLYREQNIIPAGGDLKQPAKILKRLKSHIQDGSLIGKNPGDFWTINTRPFPKAHFAVYPEELCIKPIKSSCPTQVCRKCGRPRERMKEIVGRAVTESMRIAGCNEGGEYHGQAQKDYASAKAQNPSNAKRRILEAMGRIEQTVGFTDCGCGAGFEPGIVLDPMCGAGTTLIVAKRQGIRFIGLDINPDYCEMARKRLSEVEWPLDAYSL